MCVCGYSYSYSDIIHTVEGGMRILTAFDDIEDRSIVIIFNQVVEGRSMRVEFSSSIYVVLD